MKFDTGASRFAFSASTLQLQEMAFGTPGAESTETPIVHQHIDVIACACVGAFLHGVAMALRKYYGEGRSQYYLEWRWWVGVLTDGFAGLLTWPAMPYVPVHILVPIIIVVQLTSSYFLGLFLFKEKSTLRSNVGLCCAVAGIIGVSLSTTRAATPFRTVQFWSNWTSNRFLLTNGLVLVVLSLARVLLHRSTFYALVAAVCEGIQFICSRTIAASIAEHTTGFLWQTPVILSFIGKGGCILMILHFQQLGLAWDLSRFAGIYLVSCVVSTAVYGAAFFGDTIPMSMMFVLCALCTLVGIALLNQADANVHYTPREAIKLPWDVEEDGCEKTA